MNAATQQKSALNHEAIAELARQIWHSEGCQNGRDQEYWLRAEQLLRAGGQQEKSEQSEAPPRRKVASATGKNSTIQKVSAGASGSRPRKQMAKSLAPG